MNIRVKNFIVSILTLYSLSTIGQSKDDITDTRKKNESFAKVPKGAVRSDLAIFTLAGVDESIGKEEIKKIPFSSFGTNSMTFDGDNIKAIVSTAPFDPANHKLAYDEKTLIKIDKKTYYGNYGSIPKAYISSLVITIDKDTISIPSTAWSDLYNLNFFYTDKGTQRSLNGIYSSKDGHRIYLYLFNKDNTGSYEVTWIIQDKKYLRRVLDYGFM